MGPTEEVWNSPTDWVAEHIRTYLDTDGRKGHNFNGYATLLLTTRGRKSGKLRRTALIYGREGDDYIIVASNGGEPVNPAWYLNLVAEPRVSLQVGPESIEARARTAQPEERAALWQKMTEIFEPYTNYQMGNDREIPVVILEPTSPSVSQKKED